MVNIFHLNYQQLLKKHSSKEVSEEVKNKAAEICKRRKKYAGAIPVDEISRKIEQSIGLINEIEGLLPKSEAEVNTEVRQKCSALKEKLNTYREEARELKKRFENEKIKIVIFGSKSNAKSTFIQLFTGLDEKIVSVKNPGNDLDLTGTTNIISHNKNFSKEEPKIVVIFKTTSELLEELNKSISSLDEKLRESNTISKLSFDSWDDFINEIKKKGTEWHRFIDSLDDDRTVEDFTTKKKTLLQFFDPQAQFSNVSKIEKSIEISVGELPKYNNMNNDGERHYLSVKEIRISLDLENNGMFELFEICDTKGLSTESGSEYEPILFEQINSADSTFCVQKVGGGQQADAFFQNLANKRMKEDGPKDLDKKLFIILNKCQGIEQKSVDKLIEDIRHTHLAIGIYEGSLARKIDKTKTNPQQIPFIEEDGTIIDAELFAKSVMTDMLCEIVNTTKSTDDMLWDRVSIIRPNEIEKATKELISAMDYSKIYISLDLDGILSKKILEYRTNALTAIEKIAKDQDILKTITSSINSQTSGSRKEVKFKQFGSREEISKNPEKEETKPTIGQVSISQQDANPKIYSIVTGIDEDKFPPELKSVDSDEIIKKSLDYVSEQVKNIIGNRVRGDVQTIGSFIDDFTALLYSSIAPRINRGWAPSKEIKDSKNFCNQIIMKLWSEFKLDVVLGIISSGDDLIKYITEQRIKIWYNYWNEPHFDNTTDRLTAEFSYSYNILKEFFASSSFELSDDDKKQLRPLFSNTNNNSWSTLKDAAFKVYKNFNFKHIVEQKIADIIGIKANVYNAFHAYLAEGKIDQDFIPLFKKIPKERLVTLGIISKEELDEIKQAENREVLLMKRDEMDQIYDLPHWVKP